MSRTRLRVLYLTGTSYCGSTLLSFVVNTHPQILGIGEAGPSRQTSREGYRCSCGVELVRCPFFARIGTVVKARGVAFDSSDWQLRHRYSDHPTLNRFALSVWWRRWWLARALFPDDGTRMETFRQRNEAFIDAALEVSGKSVFFDATKYPNRVPFLSSISSIDLWVLHLVRDPRGYCESIGRHKKRSSEAAAREWVRVNRAAELCNRALPAERTLRMRYEDVCSDPQAQLDRIYALVGVEGAAVPDSYRTAPHHIIGNRMRESTDGRIRAGTGDRWRDSLGESALEPIRRIAGPLAKRYGYDV